MLPLETQKNPDRHNETLTFLVESLGRTPETNVTLRAKLDQKPKNHITPLSIQPLSPKVNSFC